MHKNTLLLLTLIIYNYALKTQTVESSKSIDENILQLEFKSIFATEKENSIITKSITIPNLLIKILLLKDL
ncbi:MAG: hypothetical protein QM495_07560 [Lutibacter sp.]|uniref:hypothetical protein n=1 Tax=Lutibacter sp. TaxID=1925666 RepID=UPI00385FEFB3